MVVFVLKRLQRAHKFQETVILSQTLWWGWIGQSNFMHLLLVLFRVTLQLT